MRCMTQRRRASPESESGQYDCTSASHLTSAISLARLSCGTDNPPTVGTEDESAVATDLSEGRLTTPGIVRSSSGPCCTSTTDEAGCAENISSFEGKCAQMMVQTKINPAAEMEFVTAFPDRS